MECIIQLLPLQMVILQYARLRLITRSSDIPSLIHRELICSESALILLTCILWNVANFFSLTLDISLSRKILLHQISPQAAYRLFYLTASWTEWVHLQVLWAVQIIKSIRDRMQAFCTHPGIHGWRMFIDIVGFDNGESEHITFCKR